jgi:hypothetical protein
MLFSFIKLYTKIVDNTKITLFFATKCNLNTLILPINIFMIVNFMLWIFFSRSVKELEKSNSHLYLFYLYLYPFIIIIIIFIAPMTIYEGHFVFVGPRTRIITVYRWRPFDKKKIIIIINIKIYRGKEITPKSYKKHSGTVGRQQ